MADKIPFVDLDRAHTRLAKPLEDAYRRVVAAGSFIQGREVDAFEQEWSAYCGVPHTVGCANGTDALMLILMGLGVGPGDEIVTVANTFFATVEAIITVGATPVMVDVRREDGLIDVTAAKAAITPRTKALLVVHLYGQPCELSALKQLCEETGVALIEDAAQGHGARYDGAHVGGFGTASAFSFFPGKNLGALGDAGAVTTRDSGLAEVMRSLRNHGRGPKEKYAHHAVGYNMRMDGMQAAFLRAKLPYLPEWIADRRRVAAIYRDGLRDLSGLSLFEEQHATEHAYHLFVVRLDGRDEFAKQLDERGVATGVHYPLGCHQQPALKGKFPGLSLPVTEEIASTCLSLPLFGWMRDEEAHAVVRVVQELWV